MGHVRLKRGHQVPLGAGNRSAAFCATIALFDWTGVPLVAGMAATVTDVDADPVRGGGREGLMARVEDVFYGPRARVGCIPAITTEQGPIQSRPVEQESADLSRAQINPGLRPGMNDSPRNH